METTNKMLNQTTFEELMAKTEKPMFVAKINNELITTEMCDEYGWFGATLDSFMITAFASEQLAVKHIYFDHELNDKVERIAKPVEGSKLYGTYRDKGSVSAILERYVPRVFYTLNSKDEVANLCNLLDCMDKHYIVDNLTVIFDIDVVADTAEGRDNVAALFKESFLELKSHIENISCEYTFEEMNDLDVVELVESRNFNHRVVIVDKDNNDKIVHDFGEVAILLENFFYQPQHDNCLKTKVGNVAFTYNQMIDGIQTLTPSLYKALIKSIDYSYLHELMITGNVGFANSGDFSLELEKHSEPENSDELDDLF